MKRHATLLVLSAVAALVAALLLWDRGRPASDEAARAQEKLLPSFDRAAATELTIERGAVSTALRHEAGGWYTTTPHRRADDAAVEGLLGALEYGQIARRIGHVDAATRAELGLDHPRVVVRVAGHTLRIGGEAPARAVYVQRDDEPDALVADHRLVETADLDPSLWRSLRLTLSDPLEAARVAYGPWAAERRNGWRIARPVSTRADDAKVDALLQSLARARAKRELPNVGAAEAGQGAATSLSLEGAVEARIGGVCPGAPAETEVFRADGAVLCFVTTELNLLRAPPTSLYQRRLFPLRLDDLVAADVGPLSLRRADGRWQIVAPAAAAGPARDEAVRAWLEPLLTAEARAFVAAAPVAGLHVRLASRDDDVAADLAATSARRAGESVTLELAAALSLTIDPAKLREPAAP